MATGCLDLSVPELIVATASRDASFVSLARRVARPFQARAPSDGHDIDIGLAWNVAKHHDNVAIPTDER